MEVFILFGVLFVVWFYLRAQRLEREEAAQRRNQWS